MCIRRLLVLVAVSLLTAWASTGCLVDQRWAPEASVVRLPLQVFDVVGIEAECGVFAGIRYTVQNVQSGASYTCEADAYSFLIGAPYTGEDDQGEHAFADCYLDEVEPGQYALVSVELLNTFGQVMECCSVPLPAATFNVQPGKTTELDFLAQCTMPHHGQVDIYVPVNRQPDIVAHYFTKFFHTCELMEMAVDVTDPDGDATEVTWAVTSAPAGAEFQLGQYDTEATFVTETAGDYVMEATVCDEHGMCWSESWPLHVLEGVTQCLCP